VILNFCIVVNEMKSVTPAFDHPVGECCVFDEQMTLSSFWLDEGAVIGVLGRLLFEAQVAF
jgi:hypothetical protein